MKKLIMITLSAMMVACGSNENYMAEQEKVPSPEGIVQLANDSMQVFNPYLPSWEYVPDGEPRVFGDRLYIYGSHDAFDGPDFCVNDYVGWSAPLDNLSDWRCEGIIFKATQDPRNADGSNHMCAPDCVQGKDGRYYLYYQLHKMQFTSVAVSDSPAGPFEFYGYVQHADGTPWGEKRGDSFIFDPGVLVDTDGKAYCYAGYSPADFMRHVFRLRGNNVDGSVCLHLGDDMKTVVGDEHVIAPGPKLAKGTPYEGHGFFEASSMRKIGSKYYYVYSSELSHELCYAVSDYPDRDFQYGGTLVSISDMGYKGNLTMLNYEGNTHGGMAEINGQWYIFYHRQTQKLRCSRQACAEPLQILPDGSIPQVEMTSCGLNAGPLNGKGVYEARIACNLSTPKGMLKSDDARDDDPDNKYPFFTQTGKDRENHPDQYIANLQDGAWCGFKYFRFAGDEKSLKVYVCGNASGTLKVSLKPDGPAVAEISVQPSDNWIGCDSTIELPQGVSPLYFTYNGQGSLNFYAFEIR